MWPLKICCKVTCLTNKLKSKGVLSSGDKSSTLMKGSSKKLVFNKRRSLILSSDPDKLLKKFVIFSLMPSNLSLCWSKNWSLIEFKVVKGTTYPMSLSKIMKTRLIWRGILLLWIKLWTDSQLMISIRAWIKRLIFWKKGFLNWIVL